MSINELDMSYKPVQHSSPTHGTEETCQAMSLTETFQNQASVQGQLEKPDFQFHHAIPRQGLGQSALFQGAKKGKRGKVFALLRPRAAHVAN